jgi:hypothetical protein
MMYRFRQEATLMINGLERSGETSPMSHKTVHIYLSTLNFSTQRKQRMLLSRRGEKGGASGRSTVGGLSPLHHLH